MGLMTVWGRGNTVWGRGGVALKVVKGFNGD
jgi:hypothetical protein